MIMNPNKLFNFYSYLFINIFRNITFSLKWQFYLVLISVRKKTKNETGVWSNICCQSYDAAGVNERVVCVRVPVRPCLCCCLIWVRLRAAESFCRCWRDLAGKTTALTPPDWQSFRDSLETELEVRAEPSFIYESAIERNSWPTTKPPLPRMWSPCLLVGRC